MEQPDHDIESPMANTDLGESGHDGVPPDSDGGAPGRGSLGKRSPRRLREPWAAWLRARSWAGVAQALQLPVRAVALPLAGAVAAGGLIAVGGVTVARRLGVPVDQAAHGAGRAAVTRAARASWARLLRRRRQGLQVRS